MMADVAFVSCVKSKVDHPAPAKDLYMPSAWFRKARAYAERNARRWYILSAAHGVLHPDVLIEPYDVTLNGASVEDRGYWTSVVRQQFEMMERDLCGDRAIILAGKNYRRGLITPLLRTFGDVEVPMEGLMMGQQLQWLSRRLEESDDAEAQGL
jgi:hypothetical protein